ncbi:hypothetical protein B0T22DRAFT_436088 [Podospora appendiculata]|uniref:Protein FAF1 n=1 Tax=Podospora appendiculata TaxID=314037 RepID=A0AAE0XGK1_9PEZI|nr:hypothetical protein B0T22DRAFT_436088 [Podospora appendiculata]
MPTMLGKRKSRPTKAEEKEAAAEAAAAQARLRAHFEARFKLPAAFSAPMRTAKEDEKVVVDDEEDDDNDTDSDDLSDDGEWGGVSDDDYSDDGDENTTVVVVDHATALPDPTTSMTKRELKAYLSSKPPSHLPDDAPTTTAKAPKTPKDEDSAAFLANDLALQRLIAESHILSAAGGNASHYLSESAAAGTASNPFAAGRTRRVTTDLRVQALGAKQSVLAQAKMPMGMRKGISAAAVDKEAKRRREAKENGIILERENGGGGGKKAGGSGRGRGGRKEYGQRGERPVDLPGVGRMRGAELRISERDVRAIEASGPRGPKRGGRGGGRGGKARR